MPVHTNAIIRLASFALLFLVIVGSANAQLKFGSVNTDKIIQQLPEIGEIEKQLSALQTSFVDTLKAMEANYKARLEAYQRQQTMLSADAKTKEEEALRGLENTYAQYRQDRLGPQGVLVQYQAQLMQPVRERVRAAIAKVAKDEKLSGVLEEGAFLYIDPKLDMTFKVLDYLKRGN